jgi:L-aminopeptidase/D-esterase-like protein
MQCLGFKGGIGTSSRLVAMGTDTFTVGVLVQCNFGIRSQLRIAGIPVGREIHAPPDCYDTRGPLDSTRVGDRCEEDRGSIIAVVATDAPLLPHQLKRIAKRVSLGIGRMGGVASSSSGDLFLAFSTRPAEPTDGRILTLQMLHDNQISALYAATVQATEEAILNAMLGAETMTGADDLRVTALPHDQVRDVLRRHNLR